MEYIYNENTLVMFTVVNFMLILVNSSTNFFLFLKMKADFFKRFYTWIDLLFLLLNAWITIETFHKQNESQESQHSKQMRYLSIAGIFLIFAKFEYFFAIIDAIAPLLDIIKKILYDISYFMMISLLYILMFASCFYFAGQNQIDFDGPVLVGTKQVEITQDTIPYGTFTGSVWYITDLILGNFSRETYALGEGSQKNLLLAMFVIAAFIMLIHLLNMLIAIMGDTFSKRQNVVKEIMCQNHLKFVMDNYHLLSFAFGDIRKVRYIITAFYAPEIENADKQAFENI